MENGKTSFDHELGELTESKWQYSQSIIQI